MAAPAAPAFSPSFEVKAYGKKYEIPQEFRGLIKDADTQKKVAEVFEKSFAVEHMKTKLERTHQERAQLAQQNEMMVERFVEPLREIATAVRDGNLDLAFHRLGVKDDDIFAYAKKRIELMQLPEHQRAEIEEGRRQRLSQPTTDRGQQRQSQVFEQQLVDSGLRELEMVLELDPEVQKVSAAYDARYGEGQFEREVIMRGISHESMGQNVRPRDLARQVASQFAGFFTAPSQVPAQAPSQAQTPPSQAEQGKVPPKTLPNLNSNSASPAKKQANSLAELREMAKNMQD